MLAIWCREMYYGFKLAQQRSFHDYQVVMSVMISSSQNYTLQLMKARMMGSPALTEDPWPHSVTGLQVDISVGWTTGTKLGH